jgi:hypothetical protein
MHLGWLSPRHGKCFSEIGQTSWPRVLAKEPRTKLTGEVSGERQPAENRRAASPVYFAWTLRARLFWVAQRQQTRSLAWLRDEVNHDITVLSMEAIAIRIDRHPAVVYTVVADAVDPRWI